MASLNEIRNRVNSIASTQKITGAMKLVASAKLLKSQYLIENYRNYSDTLLSMLSNALTHAENIDTALAQKAPKETKFAILVFASNSSLCGAFNHNIIHAFDDTLNQGRFKQAEAIQVYGFGKKINQHIRKQWLDNPDKNKNLQLEDYDQWLTKPNFMLISSLADDLLKKVRQGDLHKVIIIYTHFKNRGVQLVRNETLIPVPTPKKTQSHVSNYIFEPNANELIDELLPATIKSRIYGNLLDSSASEHAARTNAMQAANENADHIIEELRVQYNRVRQEVITSEILDIIGGAEAIHKRR